MADKMFVTERKINNSFIEVKTSDKDTNIRIPRIGYVPGERDNLYVYKEGSTTNYSFEDEKGKMLALFSRDNDGNMKCRVAGKEPVDFSYSELVAMRKADYMSKAHIRDVSFNGDREVHQSYSKRVNVPKVLAYSGALTAAGLATGIGEAVVLGGLGVAYGFAKGAEAKLDPHGRLQARFNAMTANLVGKNINRAALNYGFSKLSYGESR